MIQIIINETAFTVCGSGVLVTFSLTFTHVEVIVDEREIVDVIVRPHRWSGIGVLTPSTPAVPNCCCSKGSAPYWSNPPFLIFDIRALWRSGLSTRAPECQKLKIVG